MPDFHNTPMGNRFFEGTLPALVDAITGLTTELARHNDLEQVGELAKELKRYNDAQEEPSKSERFVLTNARGCLATSTTFPSQKVAMEYRDKMGADALFVMPVSCQRWLQGIKIDAERDRVTAEQKGQVSSVLQDLRTGRLG